MPKKKTDENATVETTEVVTEQSCENVENSGTPPPDNTKVTRKKAESSTETAKRNAKKKTDESTDGNAAAEKGVTDGENALQPVTPTIRRNSRRAFEDSILTIESGAEIETPEYREEIAWHEIHNAYRTRRILTGRLGGVEQTDADQTVVVVHYNDFRILIPLKEMKINITADDNTDYATFIKRHHQILANMMGAEIDFIVRGIDSNTRSVVASRREAMMKKRQIFYLNTDANGMYRVYENRIVQARIIAVADKVIRVEVFGVECSILARDLAWDWIGDAHDRFNVGDEILVRIREVNRDSLEDISITADVKSVTDNTNRENLKKCRIQGKYIGTVTHIFKGVTHIRLSNGVNAVAHSCYDRRMPGKKDDVSFAVTHIDDERGVAVGIITRIIKQNL